MKKFLLKVFCFVSILFLLSFGMDRGLFQLISSLKVLDGECEVIADIKEGNINADIIIHGSSRAWVHIDPLSLEDTLHLSAYNLGVDGGVFIPSYFRHRYFLKYNKCPKYIIYAIDFTSLDREWENFNLKQIIPWMLWDKDYLELIQAGTFLSYVDILLPLIRYRHISSVLKNDLFTQKRLKPWWKGQIEKVRTKGYRGIDENWWAEDLEKRVRDKNYMNYQLQTSVTQKFEQFIQECQEQGIQLFLVFTPIHKYWKEINENREEIFAYYKEISSRYSIPFLDYTTLPICQDTAYFYNGRHLNLKGSQLFSKQLASDLKHYIKPDVK